MSPVKIEILAQGGLIVLRDVRRELRARQVEIDLRWPAAAQTDQRLIDRVVQSALFPWVLPYEIDTKIYKSDHYHILSRHAWGVSWKYTYLWLSILR